eukprot:gene32443-40042_t
MKELKLWYCNDYSFVKSVVRVVQSLSNLGYLMIESSRDIFDCTCLDGVKSIAFKKRNDFTETEMRAEDFGTSISPSLSDYTTLLKECKRQVATKTIIHILDSNPQLVELTSDMCDQVDKDGVRAWLDKRYKGWKK